MSRPILIGIAGGTGSGKTTVAKAIFNSLPKNNITIIAQDSYYKEQSDLNLEERIKTNYDHPLAFDNSLLKEHLLQLLDKKSIECILFFFSLPRCPW